MTTRRQDPSTKVFRQDAFASSAEAERGILGNLVASRCLKLTDRAVIAMLWWLQQVSCEGGLEKFATDFLSAHDHLIGTRSMHKIGRGLDQVYDTAQVKQVRSELEGPNFRPHEDFRVRGERKMSEFMEQRARQSMYSDPDLEAEPAPARVYPDSYPASKFVKACEMKSDWLVDQLKRFLVDPSTKPTEGFWNMPDLWPALCAIREREVTAARGKIVEIGITKTVFEELDFAFETRSFVLIEGREGIGKSCAAENWCERHPGQAIYVRLDSSTDDASFFRSMALIGACIPAKRQTSLALQPEQAPA